MRQVLREQVLDENQAAEQRQRQQGKPRSQRLEQQRFHQRQRRQGAQQTAGAMMSQQVFLYCQQHRLEGRKAKQSVGQHRQQDVRFQLPAGMPDQSFRCREQQRQQRRSHQRVKGNAEVGGAGAQ